MSTSVAVLPVIDTDSDRASTEELESSIARLSSQIDAATYRLLVLIREFDERSGWDTWAFASCAHWLSWRCGLSMGVAREKVRVAKALETLPRISEAFSRAELSYSKVRAMTRVATRETEELLLGQARLMTASQLERLTRHWRVITGDEETNEAEEQHHRRSFERWEDERGMVQLRAVLTKDAAAVLMRAIEAAQEALYDKDVSAETLVDQRRADALVLVAETALNGSLDSGSRGDRYQVVIHMDEAALADPENAGQSLIEDQGRVSAETSRRVACDSSKVAMKVDAEGVVLDVGRKTRTIPTPIRRALMHRDRHCQFPGCQNRFCDAHHVKHWASGGETKLDNLLLLCRRHHRAVHEGGYSIEWGERPRFFRPDGSSMEHELQNVSAETLEFESSSRIDAWTSGALDTGETIDWDWLESGLVYEVDRREPRKRE